MSSSWHSARAAPWRFSTMNKDGAPYLRMKRVTYLIGMVGLNELVKIHTGEEIHDSKRGAEIRPEGHRPHEAGDR